MPLTDRQIRAAKPTDKDQFISDGEGLYLRVYRSGRRAFVFRKDGRWVTIGTYPEVTLLEARARRGELADVDVSIDVQTLYKQFDQRVLAKYQMPEISRARFRNDILPALGAKKLVAVSRRDVAEVLQKIVTRGAPVMANRALADCQHLFDFAVELGYIDISPCAGITRRFVGGKERPRSRNLSWEEIDALMDMSYDGITTVAALYICLLTGQRANEVLQLMTAGPRTVWYELYDTQYDRAHKVYLSVQVRAVLRVLRGLPPPKDPRVLSHALRRVGATFTPHDLRRTMASRLSDLGVMPHVIEKMLNHKMEGVMAVYNHAEYLPDRKQGWVTWGRELAGIRRAKKRPGAKTWP